MKTEKEWEGGKNEEFLTARLLSPVSLEPAMAAS